MRPSVLYVCFDLIPSPKGAGTHVRYFVEALARRYTVTLLSLGEGGGDLYGARHRPLRLGQENYLDRALAFREAVWDVLAEERCEVVHYRSMWAALPVAEEQARRGYRSLCEVNGVDSIELKYHYPALRGRPDVLNKLRAQERLAFTTADALVTPSEVTGRYLVAHGAPEGRVTVIPNGVDLERFHPAPAPANDPPVLLYLGTLAPWQGLDLLLDALRRVLPHRAVRLRVLGAGTRRWGRALDTLIGKWGLAEAVEMLPAVPHAEVPAVIQAADLCVCPLAPTERNVVQGCSPVKLFEYLACRKPIVAGNLPVVREILTHEQDALLFKLSKPARLAEAILRLLADAELRRRLAGNARRTAETFSWARAQDALLDVYTALLRTDHPGAPFATASRSA